MIKGVQAGQWLSSHDFKGGSMWPVLRTGDGLVIEAYGLQPVCVGDVIAFRDPARDKNIVHRVIRIDYRIHTQGDNNSFPDQGKLNREDIIGKVVAVYRRDALLKLRNGKSGVWIGRVCRMRRVAEDCAYRMGRSTYRMVRTFACVNVPIRWLQSGLQIVCFYYPTGAKVVLRLWRRWPIAVYHSDRRVWKLTMIARVLMDQCLLDRFRCYLEDRADCQPFEGKHFQMP